MRKRERIKKKTKDRSQACIGFWSKFLDSKLCFMVSSWLLWKLHLGKFGRFLFLRSTEIKKEILRCTHRLLQPLFLGLLIRCYSPLTSRYIPIHTSKNIGAPEMLKKEDAARSLSPWKRNKKDFPCLVRFLKTFMFRITFLLLFSFFSNLFIVLQSILYNCPCFWWEYINFKTRKQFGKKKKISRTKYW